MAAFTSGICKDRERGREYRQVAEWLKELKQYWESRTSGSSTDTDGMTALTKEERENRKNSLERISEKMVPMFIIEGIKAEIKETVTEEAIYDRTLASGLQYALRIIDKHIKQKGIATEIGNEVGV